MKAFFSWSGGKDSALALYKAKQQGVPIEALVTTVNTTANRISMHGVRRELLEAQAASIGLQLYTIELPEMPGMKVYEEAVHRMHQQLKQEGFTHGVFGDIFLEDLKIYRQNLLMKDGLQCIFPLWGKNSKVLMNEFFDFGFQSIVACTNSSQLNESFCGRLLNEAFVNDLPQNVDPCGENGEYHSFVFDGPIFSKPVHFKKGEKVFKEYAAPVLQQDLDDKVQVQDSNDNCFTTLQPKTGFYFQDLVKA
ncbi:diphthine--ammonia ligase [Flavisolibacter ginsenosidimutans]|uniref:Diphthine--ammonia ligase n=1 Tax=Flavisolibacter ginsenosidimutans TaxID=661481 RepID=A0A5B8UIR6_9BACT|nr:diphthine--ammonia ligase [Flavisolibacter ginsenosidimutans]QEC56567.1 diphthine--ammonia ligase [Flavisolibacter ginsenosidimutans]